MQQLQLSPLTPADFCEPKNQQGLAGQVLAEGFP